MKNLQYLAQFFHTGTAEAELNILTEVYVSGEEIVEIISPPYASPRLLVGKKGTGKTALLNFVHQQAISLAVPALLLRPRDIRTSSTSDQTTTAEAERLAYESLIDALAEKLGSDLHGFLRNEAATLYESAVQSGARDRSFPGKVGKVLAEISKDLTSVDLSKGLPGRDELTTQTLARAFKANRAAAGRVFYLLVDDIDQLAAPGQPNHLNRLWGFFLAVRALTQDMPFLRVIVSVRSEVWRKLLRDPAGQRDQTDHFSPLVFELSPASMHVSAILRKRVKLAASKAGYSTASNPFDYFFDDDLSAMPRNVRFHSWRDLITARSRERPRDAIQLVAALIKEAGLRSIRIDGHHLGAVLPGFSRARIRYLENELQDELANFEAIARTFADLKVGGGAYYHYTAEQILKHLSGVPSRMNVALRQKTLSPGREDHIFELWSVLYRYGWLNARVKDSRDSRGYRYINPIDDDALVRKQRWNDMQRYRWEVNIAYQPFLDTVREGRTAERGGF